MLRLWEEVVRRMGGGWRRRLLFIVLWAKAEGPFSPWTRPGLYLLEGARDAARR